MEIRVSTLRRVENFLQKNTSIAVSINYIKQNTGLNWESINEALRILEKDLKVDRLKTNGIPLFKMKKVVE